MLEENINTILVERGLFERIFQVRCSLNTLLQSLQTFKLWLFGFFAAQMTFPVHLNLWHRLSSSVNAKCTGKLLDFFKSSRKLWKKGIAMRPLRILNVAEKNDAAKELSRIMSRGQCLRVRPAWKIMYLQSKAPVKLMVVSGTRGNPAPEATLSRFSM